MSETPALIAREFDALTGFLRGAGCRFCGCEGLARTPVPRGIAFRYDIHRRDLAAAYDFLALHLHENIPATFFLLWDYSPLERNRLAAFRDFAAKVRPPVELGLHDSPVDAYLIKTRFGHDRKAYVAWTQSADAVLWLSALLRNANDRDALNALVLEDFATRVQQTKELFGPVTTVASHGGQLGQVLTKGSQKLEPDIVSLLESLNARGWLTPERVTAAGLVMDVESFRTGGEINTQVSDTGGRLAAFARRLRRSLADGRAIQILLHPYTWAGAERDAELSVLLRDG